MYPAEVIPKKVLMPGGSGAAVPYVSVKRAAERGWLTTYTSATVPCAPPVVSQASDEGRGAVGKLGFLSPVV
jgi:hypothetical protein